MPGVSKLQKLSPKPMERGLGCKPYTGRGRLAGRLGWRKEDMVPSTYIHNLSPEEIEEAIEAKNDFKSESSNIYGPMSGQQAASTDSKCF